MKYVIGQTGEYRTHHTTYHWVQLAFDFGFIYRHFQQYFVFFSLRSVLLVEEIGVPGEDRSSLFPFIVFLGLVLSVFF
jgi:hypothetical protein